MSFLMLISVIAGSTALIIMTFSITIRSVTIQIMILVVSPLSTKNSRWVLHSYCYAECHFAMCHFSECYFMSFLMPKPVIASATALIIMTLSAMIHSITIQIKTLGITSVSTKRHVSVVMLSLTLLVLCWVSFSRVSLCRVTYFWVSWCRNYQKYWLKWSTFL